MGEEEVRSKNRRRLEGREADQRADYPRASPASAVARVQGYANFLRVASLQF